MCKKKKQYDKGPIRCFRITWDRFLIPLSELARALRNRSADPAGTWRFPGGPQTPTPDSDTYQCVGVSKSLYGRECVDYSRPHGKGNKSCTPKIFEEKAPPLPQ